VKDLEKRSLFEKIFGKIKEPKATKNYELISTRSSGYTPYAGSYFDNDVVRSCLRPVVTAVSKLTAKHLRGAEQINPVYSIKDILRQPNPFMSMADFLTKITFHRELTHNAFVYILRDTSGNPFELYPIPYSSIELIESQGDIYAKFRFMSGKQMTVLYTDLMHFRKDYNNNDIYGDTGSYALQNIMQVITTTDGGVVNAVKSSAIVKWLMKFKSILKPEDKEIQVREFVKNYLSIDNDGGVAVSDPRYDIEQVKETNYTLNAAQMDKYIQRLYGYFGVNESIIQNKYTEDEWQAFYESRIEPIIIQLSNEFTRIFFTKKQINLGNKIIFDSASLAFASMQTKLSLVNFIDRGIMTPNELREILNLAPIEGGNVPIRRLDTAPISAEPVEGVENDELGEDTSTDE